MARKTPSLQAVLDAQDEKPVRAKAARATKAKPKEGSAPKVAAQPSRAGKVQLSCFFAPEVRKQLAMMAIENDCTQQDLFAEALNDLFRKHGKSRIAS